MNLQGMWYPLSSYQFFDSSVFFGFPVPIDFYFFDGIMSIIPLKNKIEVVLAFKKITDWNDIPSSFFHSLTGTSVWCELHSQNSDKIVDVLKHKHGRYFEFPTIDTWSSENVFDFVDKSAAVFDDHLKQSTFMHPQHVFSGNTLRSNKVSLWKFRFETWQPLPMYGFESEVLSSATFIESDPVRWYRNSFRHHGISTWLETPSPVDMKLIDWIIDYHAAMICNKIATIQLFLSALGVHESLQNLEKHMSNAGDQKMWILQPSNMYTINIYEIDNSAKL